MSGPDRRHGSTESNTWNAIYGEVLSRPILLIAYRVVSESAVRISAQKKEPIPASREAKSRCGSGSMPYELAFQNEALREWRFLSAGIREQFNKKLAERLIETRIPAGRLGAQFWHQDQAPRCRIPARLQSERRRGSRQSHINQIALTTWTNPLHDIYFYVSLKSLAWPEQGLIGILGVAFSTQA